MEGNDRQKLDQWLDGALKQYCEAEPRAGLEGRIFANLRAANEKPVAWWSWWAAVVAATMFAIMAAIYLGNGHGAAKKIALVQVPANFQPLRPVITATEPTLVGPLPAALHKERVQPRRKLPSARTEPGLEQFPAPRPLTSQEQLLVRYVRERPEEAKREAQAQAELFQQDLVEFEKKYGLSGRNQTKNRD